MKVISLQGIEKRMDKQVHIGPLTFQIDPGTITALVGNNGAGKSTLIRILTGKVFPDKGVIHRFDQLYSENEWKKDIGYVPQTAIGYEQFSLKQLGELYQIGYKNWSKDTFNRLIEAFNLPKNKKFETLSVGMQKKGLILLALSHSTKLLILDEPLSGVDLESQELITKELVSYMDEDPNRSILFATHIPEEVKQLADYIVCMKRGTVTGQYEKDHLIQKFKRLWISGSEEKIRNLPGVINVNINGGYWEVMTEQIELTEVALRKENLHVISEQTISITEVLRILV
ncbi:ABC transporter ATP-binding protein [Evansella sp. AB-P1]|uniref:ATP-binding cassette domain-containing protein n=1 Tax=Evansella sp. AB-P1 TaxID=3037653 RepID=UPI00241C7426|nr:ABC transporter ATP-binding protein [Evansella sp. AB-P1]MDG5788340.1 ABC transporter ATP-binding protein [Evansella sp. AB-P1]